ncbi:MAG TPA: HEAT repeat domain-containing protein [Tepidisphaeraceae bacterium]|jgi:HEAT repeat protein
MTVKCNRERLLIVGAVCLALAVCLIVYEILFGAWNPFNRAERLNARMEQLRTRFLAKPTNVAPLDELIRSLRSDESFERAAAATYIGRIGPQAERAVDPLVETLKSNDPYSAREAARALGEIGPSARRSVPALIQIVKEYPDSDRGWFAAEALGKVADSNDTNAVAALIGATNHSNKLLRYDASVGLRNLEMRRHLHDPQTQPARRGL